MNHSLNSVLQVYLAQSLYKAGMYPEATRAAVRVDSPQYQQRMIALQVCNSVSFVLIARRCCCVAFLVSRASS